MNACTSPTSAGPCARPRGHRDTPCMDLIAYSDSIVAERNEIVKVADLATATLTSRAMIGAVVILAADPIRASVMTRIREEVAADRTAFARGIAECFAAEIPPMPALNHATDAALGLDDFMVALMPELTSCPAPVAHFERRVRERRADPKDPGATLLVLDDVQGVALRGCDRSLVNWLLGRSAEIPMLLGTTDDGWRIFRGYVEALGFTNLLQRRATVIRLTLP